MSRYRKVDVRVWGDAGFCALSRLQPSGQGLWLYLLTARESGAIPGLFIAGEAALAEGLGWTLRAFRSCFREIEEQRMARADWRSRLVWLPKAILHNRPANLNAIRKWRGYWEELPDCPLKASAWASLDEFFTSGLKDSSDQAGAQACLEAWRQACRRPSAQALAHDTRVGSQIPDSGSQIPDSGVLPLPPQGGSSKPPPSSSVSFTGKPPQPPPSANGPTFGPEELLAAYNRAKPPECPEVRDLTPARRKKYRAYLAEFPARAFWEGVFANLHKSRFLRGLKPSAGHEGFRANLDWLCTRGKDGVENVVKVSEGRYGDDQGPPSALRTTERWAARAARGPIPREEQL